MNLLNEASDSKFVTRHWNIVNDQLNANYSAGKKIIYSTEYICILRELDNPSRLTYPIIIVEMKTV